VFDELLLRIDDSDWPFARQAFGEIVVVRAALIPEDNANNVRLQALLKEPFTTEVHLGLVYTSAAAWTDPLIRKVSHQILVAAIPQAREEMAEALMGTFTLRGPERFPNDALTSQLLESVAAAPDLFLSDSVITLVERLKELLQDGYSPVAVGKLARRIVDVTGDAIANVATALSTSAEDLIDIAITLQKFPEARADGTWIFERLMIRNAYPVAKTVPVLDRRF